jgi:hypothetical protein
VLIRSKIAVLLPNQSFTLVMLINRLPFYSKAGLEGYFSNNQTGKYAFPNKTILGHNERLTKVQELPQQLSKSSCGFVNPTTYSIANV